MFRSMENAIDPVPEPVRTLMQLLAGELAAVRFPDVDGERLGAAARDVEAAALALADAEAALEAARQQLSERQEALLTRAHRAVGYLRVFAEGDAALEARLLPIVLPRRRAAEPAAATGEPLQRRRGRPPKSDKGAPLLAGMRATEGATARPQDANVARVQDANVARAAEVTLTVVAREPAQEAPGAA